MPLSFCNGPVPGTANELGDDVGHVESLRWEGGGQELEDEGALDEDDMHQEPRIALRRGELGFSSRRRISRSTG